MQIKNDEKKRRLAALFSLYLLPKAVLCAKGCMACFMLESTPNRSKTNMERDIVPYSRF